MDPRSGDTDSDGYSDYIEVLVGSDPKDPDSIPKMAYLDRVEDDGYFFGLALGLLLILVALMMIPPSVIIEKILADFL